MERHRSGASTRSDSFFKAAGAGTSERNIRWSFSGSIFSLGALAAQRRFSNGLPSTALAISSLLREITETEKPKSPTIFSSILFDRRVVEVLLVLKTTFPLWI